MKQLIDKYLWVLILIILLTISYRFGQDSGKLLQYECLRMEKDEALAKSRFYRDQAIKYMGLDNK